LSSELPSRDSTADIEYARIWCDCTARVLESLHGSPVTGTAKAVASEGELPALPAADAAPPGDQPTGQPGGEPLWIRFHVTGRLEGEHAFQITKSDAVRMAQLLMSEPVDASVAWNDTHADAINEIFRQFAGLAATSCKSKYAGEVQFELKDLVRPEWTPASRITAVFAAPQLQPIQWTLSISRELYAVIGVLELANAPKQEPSAPRPSPIAAGSPAPPLAAPAAAFAARAPEPPARASAAQASAAPTNLDLLLDIELDASLRFGQCEMILREILELRPGSVVELNREIQEPAELLVAGRVVARGDVVIVDGSYGLRITDIAQPEQRLKSVPA